MHAKQLIKQQQQQLLLEQDASTMQPPDAVLVRRRPCNQVQVAHMAVDIAHKCGVGGNTQSNADSNLLRRSVCAFVSVQAEQQSVVMRMPYKGVGADLLPVMSQVGNRSRVLCGSCGSSQFLEPPCAMQVR